MAFIGGSVQRFRIVASRPDLVLDRVERIGIRQHRTRGLGHGLTNATDSSGNAAKGPANDAADRGGEEIEDQKGAERPGRQAMQGTGRRDGLA